jgi:hypothetical protein
MDGRCATCRWWTHTIRSDEHENEPQVCARIVCSLDAPERAYLFGVVEIDAPPWQEALTSEQVHLWTYADFGCVQWEATG